MELYTLNNQFLRQEVVDEFESVVWTERYTDAGDVTLVVPATRNNINRLRNGVFLATPGTSEVMLLETQSIENGRLTVKGYTLLKFLQERPLRFTPTHKERIVQMVNPPKWIINALVLYMCTTSAYTDGTISTGLLGSREIIPNLTVPSLDTSGSSITVGIPFGNVLDAIKTLSDTYSIGITLYLASATELGYLLVFDSYIGRNLTSGQHVNPVVRFSPSRDSLANVKELISSSGYKNVAYAFAPALEAGAGDPIGIAYADGDASTSTGFNRRSLMIFCEDLTDEALMATPVALQAILNRRAKDALANNNYVKMVDGEVVPQNEFSYGTDFRLGDVIELEGYSGALQTARITEYIRTQDSTGERTYPTVSVIDLEEEGRFESD